MWIRHNYALYNSDDISKIEVKRTKLHATFKDGTTVIIGEFRGTIECQEIFSNIMKALLFENDKHPGIIIRDTKEKK